MTASELYRSGRLAEATDAQIQQVKAHPTDPGSRVFLFELLAFQGELDRARRQLEALPGGDAEPDLARVQYLQVLDSEVHRRRVFAEGIEPEFLGKADPHLALRLEAAGAIRQGRPEQAATLLAEADACTPPFTGTLNGKPFQILRDADDLFSGILEVMAQGKYFWVGLDQVVSVSMNPPKFPRDLLYIPARIELETETGEVVLPALYPKTHAESDDALRLGRATDWRQTAGGPVLGLGSRLFLVDEEAVPLLEWRQYLRDEPDGSSR